MKRKPQFSEPKELPLERLDSIPDVEPRVWAVVPNKDKIAMVRLDGTAITDGGRLVQHKWLAPLTVSVGAYKDVTMTPVEAQSMELAYKRFDTGASIASVMRCLGKERCPMASTCPHVALQDRIDSDVEKGLCESRNVIPIGQSCPVEQRMLLSQASALADELKIGDGHDQHVDRMIILELAETMVLKHRVNAKLAAEYPDMTETKLVSITATPEGDQEHYFKDMADLFKIKEKLNLREDKLRKELLATRDSKRKVEDAGASQKDVSVLQSNLLSELRDLKRNLSQG